MFKQIKLNALEDYFKLQKQRKPNSIYFCRLTEYSPSVEIFLQKYMDAVRQNGVYLKGKIANPDERQLSFYEETMGLDFSMTPAFIDQYLQKWLPRLIPIQRHELTNATYEILSEIQALGKTENMLKNAFIKFMCWFYYKFERILNCIGKNIIPKILYIGDISQYELKILRILAYVGCDILLLEYHGDLSYSKLDPQGKYSQLLAIGGSSFPADFNVQKLGQRQQPIHTEIKLEQVEKRIQTNTWISGDIYTDVQRSPNTRGTDLQFYYTVFARVLGVEDKGEYYSTLFKWKLNLEKENRTVFILEQEIPVPTPDEVLKISRKIYRDRSVLLADMQKNIMFPSNLSLQSYVKNAFYEILSPLDIPVQKLLNKSVLLLCWISRYLPKLFQNKNFLNTPIFIFYGICRNTNEADFLRLLSRLPVDVLILNTDLQKKCCLQDPLLFEKRYSESLPISNFPTEINDVQFNTVAFQAENELNSVLYADTGLYRNRQFKKADPILLHTTYEEIFILWKEDAQYRPNFETLEHSVILPTLFAKINGVAGTLDQYWKSITDLISENTIVIRQLPHLKATDTNPIKPYVTSFLKNGKLQIQNIKAHHAYQYTFLREEIQDYIFDKLQQLIDRKIIAGTMTHGIEYTILSVALNLDKQIIRLIQNFDFTKAVPKVVVISTGETICSVEDSILLAYLNALGFDIALFIPTGYQSVELHYTDSLLVEHQIGAYQYDLQIPNFKTQKHNGLSFTSKLFGKGK